MKTCPASFPSEHVCAKSLQLCPILCDPMDCSPSGSSVHGILQARILEWVAISYAGGIFPTQGWNLGLLRCRKILYQLSHQGSPIAWKIFIPDWMSVCVCVCVCACACACMHLQPCVHVVCTCSASWFRFVLFCFRNFYPFSYTHTAAYAIM